MRVTSDGLKILIDEAEVDVQVLLCHFLFSSKRRLCEEKPSGSETLLLSAKKEKKRNLFSQHIHISTLKRKDKLWDCGMSSVNPFENTNKIPPQQSCVNADEIFRNKEAYSS